MPPPLTPNPKLRLPLSDAPVSRAELSGRSPMGREPRPIAVDLNLGDLDAVYQRARTMCVREDPLIVDYFEQAQMQAEAERRMERMYALPRHPHLGRPPSLMPYTMTMIEGVSEMVQRVMRSSDAFMTGFAIGTKRSLANDPAAIQRLTRKIRVASLIPVVTPAIFSAGVAYGVVKDLVDSVTGLVSLIQNFDEFKKSVANLFEVFLSSEESARGLGELVGVHFGDKIITFSNQSIFRVTFELGRLCGPALVGVILALTGVGMTALAMKFGKELISLATKFPKVAKILDGLLDMAARTRELRVGKMVSVSLAVAAKRAGMTSAHAKIFQDVASSSRGLNRIIAVRFTNPKSVQWIAKGFPGKPMAVKIKTSKKTGIVTVSNATKKTDIDAAYQAGYYIVDAKGVARNASGKPLPIKPRSGWTPEPGQVIDPKQKLPVVGDYDLHAVIKPNNRGQNIIGVPDKGWGKGDHSNPEIRKVADALNTRMDQPRVMHGASDGFEAISDAGHGTVVFMPDGKIHTFERVFQMEEWFESIGRKTIVDSYRRVPNNVKPGKLRSVE